MFANFVDPPCEANDVTKLNPSTGLGCDLGIHEDENILCYWYVIVSTSPTVQKYGPTQKAKKGNQVTALTLTPEIDKHVAVVILVG